MQKFVPNWKVMIMTLVFFLWALFVRDTMTLFQTYIMICVPAGWFVLNRLWESKKRKKEDNDGAFPFGPFADIPIIFDTIRFLIKLAIAIVIGPIALPFILIIGILHLFTGKSD